MFQAPLLGRTSSVSDSEHNGDGAQLREHRGRYPEAEDPILNAVARHVFAPKAERIAGVEYAIEYELAERYAGGDVLDVYQFDNGSVAFLAADVSGRGGQAAMRAALLKFAARAYASAGMTPETVVHTIDRLYIENNRYEKFESFATLFFGHIDAERKTMGYASAAHDLAIFAAPGCEPEFLPVTAPLIGFFEDRRDLFRQRFIELQAGSILVVATDGITESRNARKEFFGEERLLELVRAGRNAPMSDLSNAILEAGLSFCSNSAHDDMAVVAIRFL